MRVLVLPLRETRGILELVDSLENGGVRLSGWVAPLEAPSIESLDVEMVANGATTIVPGSLLEVVRAASPDVADAHRLLHDADRARFFIAMAPDGGKPLFADRLVMVTPRFADGSRGIPIANLLSPRLSGASQGDVLMVGGGMQVGYEVFGQLVARTGLTRDMRVLDVGCGLGRMAYPLSYYLSPRGSFCGFDIMRDVIARAQSVFAGRRGFRFDHVDVFNMRYNAGGKLRGDSFRFPYEDRSFDVLYLSSVFTHMLEREVMRYLDEFARVLVPGGRALVTCFLLNPESEALIAAGKSTQKLTYRRGVARVADPKVPENAIGFPEAWMRQQVEARGLALTALLFGSWCGRERWISYQDMLILEKRA